MKYKLERSSSAINRLQEKVNTLKTEVGIPEGDLDTLYAIFLGFCSDMQDKFIRSAVGRVKRNIAEHLWHSDISMEKAAEYVEMRYILEELERQNKLVAGKKNCWFFQSTDADETALADFDLQRRYYIIETSDKVDSEWDFFAEKIVSEFPLFCVNSFCFDSMEEIEDTLPGIIQKINDVGGKENA